MTSAIPPQSSRPEKGGGSRRLTAVGLVTGAVVVLATLMTFERLGSREEQSPTRPSKGAAGPTTSESSAKAPWPSRSGAVPLEGPTGLRLLVADVPPFVLDLDRESAQRITRLPTGGDRGVSVVPVGKDALLFSYRFCNGCRAGPSVYLVRRGSTAAAPLATPSEVVPARDGEGVWTFHRHAHRCTIREIGLDGRPVRSARHVSCRVSLVAELPTGLLVSYIGPGGTDAHNALILPDTGVLRLRYQQAQPVVGNLLLTGLDRRTPLRLHDIGSGATHRLRWPSRPDYSLGDVTGDPNGRLAIVEFAKFSPEHRVDMWLLDTQTHRWKRLPGMPARIVPKATDVEWSLDGRVVILSGNVLGVWRPGSRHLAVGQVRPSKQPGSNFVVW